MKALLLCMHLFEQRKDIFCRGNTAKDKYILKMGINDPVYYNNGLPITVRPTLSTYGWYVRSELNVFLTLIVIYSLHI